MDLFRSFIEHLVAQGASVAPAEDVQSGTVPQIDWDAIWAAGNGAPTVESAIGSIVTVAFTTARDLAAAGGTPFLELGSSLTVSGTLAQPPATISNDQAAAPLGAESLVDGQVTDSDEKSPLVPSVEERPPLAPPTVATQLVQGSPPPPLPSPAAPSIPTPASTGLGEAPNAEEQLYASTGGAPHSEFEVPAATIGAPPPQEVSVPWFVVPAGDSPSPEDVDDLPSDNLQVAPGFRQSRALRRSQKKHGDESVPPLWATIFTWVRNVGAIILLFVAWQLWGTALAQHHAQGLLKEQFQASVRADHTARVGGATKLLSASATVSQAPEGSVVGHLQIPAIGVDQYVVSGTATEDLSKGPGHYIGTAMPGQAGNVAIAGHRTTDGAPFNQLGHMKVGDKIELTSVSGQLLTYVVSQVPVAVSPSEVSVLSDFGDNRVTLTTCNPEYSAAQRLIVVGKLVKGASSPTVKSTPVTYHVVNPATASWRWHVFPFVLIEGVLLIGLGLIRRWLRASFGRIGHWIILTPIWVAGLFLFFTSLTSFLPASL
jgi:sortase A